LTSTIFEAVESGAATVYIPAFVLAEILYLSEKQRITISLQTVADLCDRVLHYEELPLSFAIVQSAGEITDIRELHDRLIAGTARSLRLELITNDPSIQASASLLLGN
jgi:predicted nucleic acid-binding protein